MHRTRIMIIFTLFCEMLNSSSADDYPDYPGYPSSEENPSQHGNKTWDIDNASAIPETRVMRGDTAKPGEFPHQVYFSHKENGQEYMCSASIIHPLLLLTAAHCVHNLTPDVIDVVTGEHDLSRNDGTEQRPPVASIIMHEHYDSKTQANDIAILVLQNALKFDNFTKPIKIPNTNQILPRSAYVSGWGSLGNNQTSKILQKAPLDFVGIQNCLSAFKNRTMTDGMICAGKGDKDVCFGDSGGPLTCDYRGEKFLCGIVSWGYSCEHKIEYKFKAPGVYTDVRKYHAWIENHTIAETTMLRHEGEGSNGSTSYDCGAGEFRCGKNGICIPNKFRCDGKIDCPAGDGSDERNCPSRRKCPHGKFWCFVLKAFVRQQHRYVKIFCKKTTRSAVHVYGGMDDRRINYN